MDVKVFGKTLMRRYDHYIYKLEYKAFKPHDEGRLTQFEVGKKNLGQVRAAGRLAKIFEEQSSFVYGLGFCDEAGNVIGRAFILSKGGANHHYRIRNIDAYLFGVEVFEEYRGCHYSADMVTKLIRGYHKCGVNEYYLAVLKDNIPARKVYERLGFKIIGERSFHRIPKLDLNIPYYEL